MTQEFLNKWEKEIFIGKPETLESIKEKIEYFQMLLDLVNLPKIVSK